MEGSGEQSRSTSEGTTPRDDQPQKNETTMPNENRTNWTNTIPAATSDGELFAQIKAVYGDAYAAEIEAECAKEAARLAFAAKPFAP